MAGGPRLDGLVRGLRQQLDHHERAGAGRGVRPLAPQEHFTERRYQWLEQIPFPRANTVLVRNIPPMYRSDAALRSYFTPRGMGFGEVD